MPIITNDTFTATAGTLLENHTGETGAVWTKNPAFSTGSAAITAANRVRGNSNNATVYYASGVPSSADYDVEADLYVASSAGNAGIIGRQSTSAGTYYLFAYIAGSGWTLYTLVNGANQNSTVFAQTLTIGQTYHLRLSMRGSQITCYVNGTQIIQITDTHVAAGQPGLYFSEQDTDSTGLHLDNLAASTPATVAITDPNLFFSPYNWSSDGGGSMLASNVRASSTMAQTNTPGAYLKFNVSAASAGNVALLLDTSPLNGITAANCPTLAVSVDGQAFATPLLAYAAGTTRLQLAGSLAAGTHTFAIYFRSVTSNSSLAMGDRWNTPASVVKLTGIELDGKGSAAAAPTLRSKRMIVYGDSITEAVDAVGNSNANADQDSTQSYAQLIGAGLDAEVGIIGWSAQGWTVAGYGNVPRFYDTVTPANSTFDKYYAGTSRLIGGALVPPPDYVAVLHGRNDASQGAADASVTSAVSAWLPAMRSGAPAARIFVIIPFDGSKRSAITAGFNAAPDPHASLIDLGAAIQPSMSSGGLHTNDGIHPNARGHATFGAMLIKQMNAAIGGSGAGTVNASTGSFVGSSVQLSTGGFTT